MTDYIEKGTVAGLVCDLRQCLVALDATVGALEDYSDADQEPVKSPSETHPDAKLFACCGEWRGFADLLNLPDRGDTTDDEQAHYRDLSGRVWDTPTRTPEGLAVKMQTTIRRYEGLHHP